MINPSFAANYPGAIVFPAHWTNYFTPGSGFGPMRPRGFVLHTPEEPADDVESTPAYFAGANRQASTHYYIDNDGDVYQCVSEDWFAFANGVRNKPYPAWADPSHSLNWQTLSVEIEGFAATIQDTMPVGGPQWLSLLALLRHRCAHYAIPLDREHVIGHYQVADNRSDPGALFPWDALIRDLNAPLPKEDDLSIEERERLERLEARDRLTRFLHTERQVVPAAEAYPQHDGYVWVEVVDEGGARLNPPAIIEVRA